MGNSEHLRMRALRSRHYVRKATTWNYWFDFSERRVDSYHARYGSDFCLVIHGAEWRKDSYVIPWEYARPYFRVDLLDERRRWIGTIIDERLKLGPASTSLSVAPFRNRLDLLGL